MTMVVNESACSDEFKDAMSALESGQDVRRHSWPAGTYLHKNGDRISVFRNYVFAAPTWYVSAEELEATDWAVLQTTRSRQLNRNPNCQESGPHGRLPAG